MWGGFAPMYVCLRGSVSVVFGGWALCPRCSGPKCTWHKQEVQTTNIYARVETPLSWQGGCGEYLYSTCAALEDFWTLGVWYILEREAMQMKYAQLWSEQVCVHSEYGESLIFTLILYKNTDYSFFKYCNFVSNVLFLSRKSMKWWHLLKKPPWE